MPSKKTEMKDIETRALDVIKGIERTEQFIEGLDREAFLADQKTQSAVERELLRISEASTRLHRLEEQQKIDSKARLSTRFPQIPWSQIIGIGNILRHDYGRVDAGIAWATVNGSDLEELKAVLLSAFPTLNDR